MATIYLFDMHVPVLANARLVDVVSTTASDPEVRVDGLTPIKVPDGVRVVNPTSLTDLLAQKYAGILAMYPGLANIIYDDLLDGSGIEASGQVSKTGGRGSVGGACATLLTDPNADVTPTVVSQCILVCEEFTWRYVDPKNGRLERYYVELPGSSVHGLSVNGGASYSPATSGAVVAFPPAETGSLVNIRLFNFDDSVTGDGRVKHIGSWAVIY